MFGALQSQGFKTYTPKGDTLQQVGYEVIDGDTLPVIETNYSSRDVTVPLTDEEYALQLQWVKLLRDLDKVWPLVQASAVKIREVDSALTEMERRRDERRLIREEQDKMADLYEEQLRKLNKRQGLLLIKLLHRQLGISSYDLIRKYRNGFTALKWQSLAKLYGVDLKEEYIPAKEELIERALAIKGYD